MKNVILEGRWWRSKVNRVSKVNREVWLTRQGVSVFGPKLLKKGPEEKEKKGEDRRIRTRDQVLKRDHYRKRKGGRTS